jgi:hypothetical protein
LNHRGRGVFADFGAVGAGVEIEMDAEETVGAFEARGSGGGGGGGEGGGDEKKGEGDGEKAGR